MMSCRVALLFSLVGFRSGVRPDEKAGKKAPWPVTAAVVAVQDEGAITQDVHELVWGARPMSLAETISNETTVKLETLKTNDIHIGDDYLYSEGDPDSPCVVFFPGDLSALTAQMQLQPQTRQLVAPEDFNTHLQAWSLEGIHQAIAAQFPKHTVVTISGQLNGITRSFPGIHNDPRAVVYLEWLLHRVLESSDGRVNPVSSRLIVVGFSRGGEALSGLINGARVGMDFWNRVDGIYFVDCWPTSWDITQDGLKALGEALPEPPRLSVQWTGYGATMAGAGPRDQMLGFAKRAGLTLEPVTDDDAPSPSSFTDHMDFLKSFKVFGKDHWVVARVKGLWRSAMFWSRSAVSSVNTFARDMRK